MHGKVRRSESCTLLINNKHMQTSRGWFSPNRPVLALALTHTCTVYLLLKEKSNSDGCWFTSRNSNWDHLSVTVSSRLCSSAESAFVPVRGVLVFAGLARTCPCVTVGTSKTCLNEFQHQPQILKLHFYF